MTAPSIAGAAVALGIVFLLLRFRRKNDLQAWMKILRDKAERAATDPDFRDRELQEAEEQIAQYTPPEPAEPVKRKQEMYIQLLPKFLFLNGSGGALLTWIGLFQPPAHQETNWMLIIGLVLLAATGIVILLTARLRRHHAWLQQLNRKYLMQKAAGDENGLLATIDRILQYYPGVPELWLEKADQLSRFNRLDEALIAVEKARSLAPKSLDIAVVEISFMLRNNRLNDAERALKQLDEMEKAPSDPRAEIYRAQLALLRNELTKAKKHAEKAAELDASFTTRFLDREDSLKDLRSMMQEMKLIF